MYTNPTHIRKVGNGLLINGQSFTRGSAKKAIKNSRYVSTVMIYCVSDKCFPDPNLSGEGCSGLPD